VMGNKAAARADAAAYGLGLLGSSARVAIPELSKLLDDPNLPRCRSRALFALCNLGNEGLAVVLSSMNSSDRNLRISAISAIGFGGIGTNATVAVPALIQILEHGDEEMAFLAGETLGNLRIEPETVVPALVGYLRKADPFS